MCVLPLRSSVRIVVCLLLPIIASASGVATAQLPPPAQAASGLILGRVVDADTKAPIPNAIASLIAEGKTIDSVRTNRAGEFLFKNLPKGSYEIGAVKPGYLGTAGRRLQLQLMENQQVVDVAVAIRRYASLAGTVFDESGEPLVGVSVRLLSRSASGQWRPAFTQATDDRGVFRFASLDAGEFVVAVPSTQASVPGSALGEDGTGGDTSQRAALTALGAIGVRLGSPDAMEMGDQVQILTKAAKAPSVRADRRFVYPTQFYPAARTSQQAQILTLRSGEQPSNIDLRLTPVPAVRLAGTIHAAPPISPRNFVLHLVPVDAGMGFTIDVATTMTDAQGRFAMPLVPEGDYLLRGVEQPRAQTRPGTELNTGTETVRLANPGASPAASADGHTVWVSQSISVHGDDLLDVSATLGSGFRVTGQMEFDGLSPRPTAEHFRTAQVLVWSEDGSDYFSGGVDQDGRVWTRELPPGRYVVGVTLTGAWKHRSSMFKGQDIWRHAVEVTNADVGNVVFGMSDHLPTMSGIVRDSQGRPMPMARVIAFPTDQSIWAKSGTRGVVATNATATGDYSMEVTPGEYFVAALEEQAPGYQPGVDGLRRFAASAPRVVLAESDGKRLDLQVRTQRLESEPSDSVSGPYVADEPQQPAARDASRNRVGASGVIVGRVLSTDADARPIRSATVMLNGAEGRVAVTRFTDDQGRFEFAGLPEGRFKLSVSKPAYLATEYGATRPGRPGVSLVIRPGERAVADLILTRCSVVEGTVTGLDGEPVPGVTVRVMNARHPTREGALVAASGATPAVAQTDDRGRFRIFGLFAGDYYVGVTASGGALFAARTMSDDDVASVRRAGSSSARSDRRLRTYAPTYYPSNAGVAGAQIVTLGAAEERTDLDIRMQLAPVVQLSGRVLDPAGQPSARASIAIVPIGSYMPGAGTLSTGGTVLSLGGFVNARSAPDGRFTVGNLTAGTYTLFAQADAARPGSGTWWGQINVTVGEVDISDLAVALQAGLTATGKVVARESGEIPDTSNMRISLKSASSSGLGVNPPAVAVDSGGRFTVTGVTPGRYLLTVAGLPKGWRARSALVGSDDGLDVPVSIEPSMPVPEILLTLVDRQSELSGLFSDAAGRPTADYTVIVFSASREHWLPQSRRIQAVRPGADGRFLFRDLPPGTYRLAAVTDIIPNEWFDPVFLTALEAAAATVTLGEGERKTQDLQIARR